MTGEPIDPGVIEVAGRVFDLARGGHTDELATYVDAGGPSARATAQSFGLTERSELLARDRTTG